MTWSLINLTGNLVISSVSKDSRGVRVPEVRIILRGLNRLRFANPIPGFKQTSLMFKSKKSSAKYLGIFSPSKWAAVSKEKHNLYDSM